MNVTDSNPAADHQNPIGQRRLRPLNDRIVVRRLGDTANESALIVAPEIAQSESKRGLVVACGKGKRDEYGKLHPLVVQPGDVIYFGRYTDFDDGEHLIIQEADVVGIVTGGD